MTSPPEEHSTDLHGFGLPPPAPGERRHCLLLQMFPIQTLCSLTLQAQISLGLFLTCPKWQSCDGGLAHAEHLLSIRPSEMLGDLWAAPSLLPSRCPW